MRELPRMIPKDPQWLTRIAMHFFQIKFANIFAVARDAHWSKTSAASHSLWQIPTRRSEHSRPRRKSSPDQGSDAKGLSRRCVVVDGLLFSISSSDPPLPFPCSWTCYEYEEDPSVVLVSDQSLHDSPSLSFSDKIRLVLDFSD